MLLAIVSILLIGGICVLFYVYEVGTVTIFFLIIVSLLILYLCTESGRKKFLKRCYRLGSDNNAWILPVWIAVLVSAVFSFDSIVRGGHADQPVSLSIQSPAVPDSAMPIGLNREWRLAWYEDECSQALNPELDNRKKKIQTCAEQKEEIRAQHAQPLPKKQGRHWLVVLLLFFWNWRTLTLFLIACGVTFFVLRDELGRAWKAAKDRVFVRKGWSEDLPNRAPSAQVGDTTQGAQTSPANMSRQNGKKMASRLAEFAGVMFSFELLEEVFKHILRTRRGGIV